MDDMDQDHTELYIELAETAKEHTDDLLDRDLWLSSPAYPKTMAMFGSWSLISFAQHGSKKGPLRIQSTFWLVTASG